MFFPTCYRNHSLSMDRDLLRRATVICHGGVPLVYDDYDLIKTDSFNADRWARRDNADVCRALAYPELEDFLRLVGYDFLEEQVIGDYS